MTLKAQVKDWMARLAGAKTALGELHGLDKELRAQLGAARQIKDDFMAAGGKQRRRPSKDR